MKIYKKSKLVVLSFVMLLICNISVFATSIDYDDYLKEMGTPIEIINKLNEEIKKEIVEYDMEQEVNGTFDSSVITQSKMEKENNTSEILYLKEYNEDAK